METLFQPPKTDTRIYDKRPKVVHAEERIKGAMPVHGVVSGSIRPVLQSIPGGKE